MPPHPTPSATERLILQYIVGYDVPFPNGCWKCIGCGKLLSPRLRWNQCADCDTREPEEKW